MKADQVKAWKKANADRVRESNQAYQRAHPDKIRQFNQRWAAKDPERTRNIRLKAQKTYQRRHPDRIRLKGRKAALRRFGLTVEDYDSMLQLQNGGCAICDSTTPGQRKKHFHLDHDHRTGHVRGLLCSSCNLVLGLFGDSPARFIRASAYLEAYKNAEG